MSLARIYSHFRDREAFPITADHIVDRIEEIGFDLDVNFHGVDMDSAALYGFHVRTKNSSFAKPYQSAHDLRDIIDIYYSKELNPCRKNFSCTKEIVHILDNPKYYAGTESAVETLAKELTSQTAALKSVTTFEDTIGAFRALALLVPEKAASKMDWQKSSDKDMDIAKLFKIPVEYVPVLFSDHFKSIRDTMMVGAW